MDKKLTSGLLLSILVVQIGGFWVVTSRLNELTAPRQPILSSSISPGVAVPALGSAGSSEGRALRKVSILSPSSAADCQDAVSGRPDANRESTPAAGAPAASDADMLRQSNDVVNRALLAGVWTDHDGSELRKHMLQLNETDRIALLEKLAGAINNQQLNAKRLF